jgi:hypothetical protein
VGCPCRQADVCHLPEQPGQRHAAVAFEEDTTRGPVTAADQQYSIA